MRTILVTGFGPFPGAPVNPTETLVRQLARRPPAGNARIKIVPHVFRTSYAAVDRELPLLLRHYRPDAILMFGLAGKAETLRIETRARNALSQLPDADGVTAAAAAIAPHHGAALPLPTPHRRLSAAARAVGAKTVLSADAGDYLCNYLCWRSAQAARQPAGPRLAAFIHVPPHQDSRDLLRAGGAFLSAMIADLSSARSARCHV